LCYPFFYLWDIKLIKFNCQIYNLQPVVELPFCVVGGPKGHKLFKGRVGPKVSSKKIVDKGPSLGYSIIITDGNARLAQLNASPSRIPGSSGRQTLHQTRVSLLQEQLGRRYLPGIFLKKNKKIKRFQAHKLIFFVGGWAQRSQAYYMLCQSLFT